MKVFMTNGTFPFLLKLAEKHQQIHFYFMQRESSILAYYEGVKKRVFSSGREFAAIYQDGEISEEGFVMLDNIPVSTDAQPVFENSFPHIQESIIKSPGFQALRLLKPRRGNTYIIFTQWEHESKYEQWAEEKQEISVKSPAYFADQRFKMSYEMVEKEQS